MGVPRQPRRRPRDERTPVLLVTNGQQTEKTYLDGLKQRASGEIRVTTTFVNGDPEGVVRDLRGRSSGLDSYDEVWVVVDHDGCDRTAFLRDCATLGGGTKGHGVVSVPCFEVWLIAHDVQVDFPWHEAAAAAERSHLRGEAVPGLDTQGPCPSTTMPHLVARLGRIPRP